MWPIDRPNAFAVPDVAGYVERAALWYRVVEACLEADAPTGDEKVERSDHMT